MAFIIEIQCDASTVLADYGHVPNQGMVDVGKKISITCDTGFEIAPGYGTATCNENGEFDKGLKCKGRWQ
jgi:hypothetical protein